MKTKIKVVGAELAVLRKLIDANTATPVLTLTDQAIDAIDITDEDIRYSSDIYIIMQIDQQRESFAHLLCSIQSLTPIPPQKEMVATRGRTLYATGRLVSVAKDAGAIESDIFNIRPDDAKAALRKNGLHKHLADALSIVPITEELNLIIGKALRETWDVVATLGVVRTTTRLYGCMENGDRFSGFALVFGAGTEQLKSLYGVGMEPIVADFKHLIKG